MKYDGFRALAYLAGGIVRLVSRKGNTYKSSPALCDSLAACLSVSVSDAVLDGEIVYLGPDGKPQFYDFMRRRGPRYFYAFDLLWLNGVRPGGGTVMPTLRPVAADLQAGRTGRADVSGRNVGRVCVTARHSSHGPRGAE